nr:hypothetical protein [Tanacetum cinerariifolium]
MAVYQTYINAMNERIRTQFANSNPFDFKHISPLKSIDEFHDVGPSVVIASPSSLQSGLSRQLFDKWCAEKKNACVIPGYVVEVGQDSENHLSLQWTADPIGDMVSDSIVALVLNASREMPKVVVETETVKDEAEEQKKTEKIVHALLLNLFGNVKYGEDGRLVISVDDNVAYLDKQKGEVESENEALKERVRLAFKRIQTAVKPIPVSGTGS